jgi:hypothetical protein
MAVLFSEALSAMLLLGFPKTVADVMEVSCSLRIGVAYLLSTGPLPAKLLLYIGYAGLLVNLVN